ncbi:gag/pol protein [Cucumis melo var. makuwa]|uniref:Gag/pol protein n=1 Tax=Cucumis melo var. makuwa TaxID=1194695 RepID=A0A5D3CCD3_CUCMM|nr:gag/pol protein [Cucumis melo var. makuwa]
MNSSIVQLLAFKKLNGDNYAAWKSNLNTLLVVDDFRFVLTEECPQTPASNANRTGQEAYDRWSLRHEAIKYIYTKRMKERTSVREHVLDMMMQFNIAKVNGGAIDEANQENSSWKRLSEGKITLKVETGEMVSAKAVGDLKLYFGNRYIILKNILIGRLVKSGLPSKLEDNPLPPCESCLKGKMTKRSFTGKCLRAKIPLELVHSDLCGPMNVKAQGGYEYFISFVDDYSRYGHVYLIHHKSGYFEKFKGYKAEVENELEHGIQSQLSTPSTPQQNGVSERRNRTLLT